MTFELPELVGDTAVLITESATFHVACVGMNRWSVRRARDPFYLGELRRCGDSYDYDYDYEASTGGTSIESSRLSLIDWITELT
jgi:hypothetical protein